MWRGLPRPHSVIPNPAPVCGDGGEGSAGVSFFLLLTTHHLGRSPGSGSIHAVLDGLPGFCRCLAMVRHTETRQEYLLAVSGLDPARRRRDCWSAFLRVMCHSPAL